MTDTVVFDHAVDGDQSSVTLSASGAKRIILFFRDIQFASSDRIGIYVSEDGGSTKENGASEYEGRTLNITEGGGVGASAGYTFSAVVIDSATTGVHDGVVDIEGLASSTVRTSFRSEASDGVTVHERYNNRATAVAENALVIETIGATNMTAGQIVARVET